jgi:hypothetical protein
MSYMSLIAPCFACRRLFASNPHRVPSHDNNPICATCMAMVNERRVAKGLPPFLVPDDAYEPADEYEE